jgi:hypothetical protein
MKIQTFAQRENVRKDFSDVLTIVVFLPQNYVTNRLTAQMVAMKLTVRVAKANSNAKTARVLANNFDVIRVSSYFFNVNSYRISVKIVLFL